MTPEERKKLEEFETSKAILAHSILEQIAAIKNITYAGAFQVLDHAKFELEQTMKRQRPEIKPEILDRWGTRIAKPEAEAPGENRKAAERARRLINENIPEAEINLSYQEKGE